MATLNSLVKQAIHWKVAAILFIFIAGIAMAEDSQQKFAARAEESFHQAQKQFQSDENNPSNAVQFAHACYDFADFAKNDSQRAELANDGIDVCRKILTANPKLAEAHYYLAMNLGQLARTKSLGALKLVKEMEPEFQTALGLDKQIDFGGSARSLGLLYRDAPGWPMSIGSKRKAKTYLQQALQIAPDFPENILVMAESDLKWGDRADAQKQLDAIDALWSKAQKNLSGENWERDWADWTNRRDVVRKKISEVSAPLKSPRSGQ
jgi:tetratricopeptide (TPR) repeat protein